METGSVLAFCIFLAVILLCPVHVLGGQACLSDTFGPRVVKREEPVELEDRPEPEPPQITGFPPGPVTAGTQLRVLCFAPGNPYMYEWYKDGKKVTTSSSYDFQVTKESAGGYFCKAGRQTCYRVSSRKILDVYYKADSVVVSSGKTSSYAGEKDKFTCTVTGGNPTPTVKLFFKRSGGTPVEVTQGQDRIMVKEDNQAEYYCQAMVPGYPTLDMTSSRKTYNVTFANTKVFFLNNPTAAVQAGQMKKFTCETDESNPITYIKWYQHIIGSSWRDITTGISTSERHGVYGGKIRISVWSVTATKAMNGATVRCSSMYSLTRHDFSTNADTTMHVKFNPSKITMTQKPPTSINEGKSFNIVCETDSANPVANIQFHRKRTEGNWEQLTSGITSEVRAAEFNGKIRKSTLTVTANRLDTKAVFKCEVKDGSFQVEQTATVNVLYKAESAVVSSGKTSSYAGEKDKFTCTVTGGNPIPTVKLFFKRSGGTPVEVTQGQDRIMVKEDNQAEYYCKAMVPGYPTLDMTSRRKTYNVTFANTKVSFLNNPTAAVQAGQMKKFTCETDESNPITYIKWHQHIIGSSWRDITTGISTSESNAVYGGKIRISEWSVTATKAMNGVSVRCSSRYSLTGHDFSTNADTTMHVKFNPSKIRMTQKPPISINEGESFNIVCETDSANPVADIQFHRKRRGGTWEQLTSGITSDDRAGEFNGMIRKSTMTVTAKRLDTQAVFKCEVKDGSFQVEQTETVNVYFPPNVKISSNPNPVQEGDTLMLTCTALGGNPPFYTYKWFYKDNEIPNETSKDFKITDIRYTQSGTYKCQAINYSPDGKADGSLDIDTQYKAKWNPELPEVFTVASTPYSPMELVLHVIANPSPTNVTWFFPNMTTIGGDFVAAKVNDTTYTLNKASIGVNDYGNYIVNVTNDAGISTFNFEQQGAGPPHLPCCPALEDATAVSLTLIFMSNFTGGSVQTFTIENKKSALNVWDTAVKDIADPGTGNNVVQKISGLGSDTKYMVRVKATNDDGESGYGKILEAKTEVAPHVTLTVERKDNQVTVSWTKLLKEYTQIQIRFCPEEGGSCGYHVVADPTSLTSSFMVNEGTIYSYYMMIFDGEDVVFDSAAVKVATSGPLTAAIGGVIGGFLFLLVIVVVLAAVFILKKRRAEQDRDRRTAGGDAAGLSSTRQSPDPRFHDHIYVNVDNIPLESDAAPPNLNEPDYVNWQPRKLPVQGDGADSTEPENEEPPLGEPGTRENYLRERKKVYVDTEPLEPSVQGGGTSLAEPKYDEPRQDPPGDQQEHVDGGGTRLAEPENDEPCQDPPGDQQEHVEGGGTGLAEPEYEEPRQDPPGDQQEHVEGGGTGLAEPEYDEPRQDPPGDQQEHVEEVIHDDAKLIPVAQKKIEDISVEDFKQWLLLKEVTGSTYQVLAKNGLNKAVIFALLEREDLKALPIEPLGQEILVRNLVESFQSGAKAWKGDGQRASSGDDEDVDNPYEELNITPDVLAARDYTQLKSWRLSRADS
ncbi:uncharacterized protein LOC135501218 isoform X3 [Lineus longissimus]|uniref:uncharacterized protein LOC135501218 isoform X3 n=1 Tax=Lineus longissimus TaxID=88925 RepID=UPI00315DCEDF